MSLPQGFKVVLAIGMMLICLSCGKSSKLHFSNEEIITIEAKPVVSTLYYSDFINPIRVVPIRNIDSEGVVIEKKFEYGKNVIKGQLLLVILSQQLEKNYFDAVRQYVRSAETLSNALYQMEGEEYLNKLKIVSQQEYNTVKSQLFNAKLDYADSLNRLIKVLEDENIDTSILNKIESKNPQIIYDTLTKLPKSNLVEITAPQSGIPLMPENPEGGGETSKKPLTVGSLIKSGQELLGLGDISGISVTVKIPENYINKIKEGQKALITGDAFPGISLEGEVIVAGRQSINSATSNEVPTYLVTVSVPNIGPEAKNIIRVGMSANVEFRLESLPAINIPLTAVFIKNGQSYVKKINSKTEESEDVPVETGRTGLDSIEILDGLQNGDKVLIHASTD